MMFPDPFADLAAALSSDSSPTETDGVRIDTSRRARTGAPEIVYGKGKNAEQIAAALRRLIEIDGRALAALIDAEQAGAVEPLMSELDVALIYDPIGRTLIGAMAGSVPPCTGGRVGLISAGSSDRPQISEAAAVLQEMGCGTRSVHDVGVAGLHRLVSPLRNMLAFDPDALIVAAGMDGVLPGVISGLVSIPIVALPTSTGYGFGGEGLGAMTTMLQACAPGIAVVNIDNGVGAAVMAGLIANRAASQRLS
jgi:NCAIR mutase (PurE)-related protein